MQNPNWFDRYYTAGKFYIKLSHDRFLPCPFSSLFSLSLPFDINGVCVCVHGQGYEIKVTLSLSFIKYHAMKADV
jgi:hypothetical protein